MSYLLDTCILSKLRKIGKYPDIKLGNWLKKHKESDFFLSVLTLGEIQSGICKLNQRNKEENEKKIILTNWLIEELVPRFYDRILTVDLHVGLTWGRLSGESKKNGINIPIIDGLIASTAIAHNLTLVTENISDFIHTGARLFNPWLEK